MLHQVFEIKSLLAQDIIMLFALGLVLFFLFLGIYRRQGKMIALMLIWLGLVLWFFNSGFWGFSRIKLAPEGIELDYGVLSVAKNTKLSWRVDWSLESEFSGFPKKKRLYFLKVGERRSMKVTALGLKRLKIIEKALTEYLSGRQPAP